MKNLFPNEEAFTYNTTNNVTVKVKPSFRTVAQSNDKSQFVWSYDVTIENFNPYPIQLLSRYWKVFDANGYIEEVEGEGVIGMQPVIEAGESFNYSSQVKLFTNSGMMLGYYKMQDNIGNDLQVNIPAFSLDTSLEEMSIN
ncbi:MAG: hypothetical protein K0Q51_1552 [Rickettsiaceae bacterium]|nr:hypothetical protein [Rickettsiaceae bacterium]